MRGKGVIHFINLPSTGPDTWAAVAIPLDSLKLHSEWAGADPIALDKSRLAKMQFKVQGGEAASGIFAIDNIYYSEVGDPILADVSSPVSIGARIVVSPSFRTAIINGNIAVTLNGLATKGTVSIINAKGVVVAKKPIARTGAVSFSTKSLPAASYIVTVNGVNAQGNAVSFQSAVTLIK
jgi:hypothetical protein